MKQIVIIVILAIVLTFSYYYLNPLQSYTGTAESITIGYSPFEQTALLRIAEDRHFFSQNGLNIKLRKYDTGVGSLDGMLNGEAEITVGVTEFPVVGRAFRKERIHVIGTIAKIDQIYLVARKDRGIERISDLKGKRVGTTLRTIAHFYLGRFLELHGLDIRQDINIVDLKTPVEWVNAIADGEVDAIITARSYANSAKERLGTNAVVWPAQGGQPIFGFIVSTAEWITNHPEPVSRFLKSLAQAEEYAIRNPAEAKAIVQKRLDLDAAHMETVWYQNQFYLSLDQSLILAMEDEARWMISDNIITENQVPDFLNFIYEDALAAIKPESVHIIR